MAPETQLLWEITLGLGVVVVAVVILLLGLLRESVKSLLALVGQVWSSAVGVFVHTVTVDNQLGRAERSVRSLAGRT
jgi:hypothetical protein